MKICLAQTKPVTGDIPANIHNHKRFIDLALATGVNFIVFPELSLTGYEPSLANDLALAPDDDKLDVFQSTSDGNDLAIAIGAPVRNSHGVCISLIFFQPGQARQTYSKKYLHADEEPFFVSGGNFSVIGVKGKKLAPAICYEIAVPEHAREAARHGAEVYIASVAKFQSGMDKAVRRLSEIAKDHSMPALMANSLGFADGGECAGGTAVWDAAGVMLGQLNATDEGVLIYDTETREVTGKAL